MRLFEVPVVKNCAFPPVPSCFYGERLLIGSSNTFIGSGRYSVSGLAYIPNLPSDPSRETNFLWFVFKGD